MTKSLIFSIAIVFATSSAIAKNLYVSPTGNDSAPGQGCESKLSPCQTLSKAVAEAESEDNILLQSGIYTETSTITIDSALTVTGGYNSDFSKKTGAVFDTTINGSSVSTRLFNINYGHAAVLKFTNLSINTGSANLSELMLSSSSGALLELDNIDLHYQSISNAAISMTVANDKLTITNSTFADDESDSSNARAIKMATDTSLIITDSRFEHHNINGNGAAIELAPGMELVSIIGGAFYNNKAIGSSGGAIYMPLNSTLTPTSVIKNISFIENSADLNGGAIAIVAQSSSSTQANVNIGQSTFDNNSSQNGGAIYHGGYAAVASLSQVEIINSTFANNNDGTAAGLGGAIHLDANSDSKLSYNTFYQNNADNGGAIYAVGASTKLDLLANLILANMPNNLSVSGVLLDDSGYNLVGVNGNQNNAVGLTLSAVGSGSHTGPASDIIDESAGLNANGGSVKTIKITQNSPARNQIPNDAIPYYGVGTSESNPFVSLAQAHGALKTYSNYTAGVYYFDLGGSYDTQANNYAFTAGSNPVSEKFATFVNDDGWVLVAASNIANTSATPYTAIASGESLELEVDKTLPATVLANNDLIFDVVRITTSDGGTTPVDAINRSSSVLNNLRNFERLGNSGWLALQGESSLGTCAYVATPLNQSIYDACDNTVSGMRWVPVSGFETASVQSGTQTHGPANLNLWIRDSQALCNGAVTKIDGRGLPRSDYVNPNDPSQAGDVNNCDIGAFEFNNGYQVDCYDEDGLRPNNYVNINTSGQTGEAEYKVCFGDNLLNSTPAAIIDNVGSFQYFYSLMLLCLIALRLKTAK